MAAIKDHLTLLGFDRMPDENTLKKRFREVIFECHPDHGGSKLRSQRLIEAYRALIDQVRNAVVYEEPEDDTASTLACQVVAGSFGTYALPIDRIISIEPAEPARFRRFVHRTAFEHDGNLYTLLTIRGRPSSGHGAYCTALFDTRAGRFGLVIPARIEYSDVTSFHFQEMIWNRSRDGSMKFYTAGRSFDFPAFLSVK